MCFSLVLSCAYVPRNVQDCHKNKHKMSSGSDVVTSSSAHIFWVWVQKLLSLRQTAQGREYILRYSQRIITRGSSWQNRESLIALFKSLFIKLFMGLAIQTGTFPCLLSTFPTHAPSPLVSWPCTSPFRAWVLPADKSLRGLSEPRGITLLLPLSPVFLCPLLSDLSFVAGPHTPTMEEGQSGLLESLVLLRSFISFCFILNIMAFFLLQARESKTVRNKKAIKFRAFCNVSILH